jgi:hypothetical protein
MVVLDEVGRQTQVAKLVFAIGLHKKSARISPHLRLHNHHVIQMDRLDLESHSTVILAWKNTAKTTILSSPQRPEGERAYASARE